MSIRVNAFLDAGEEAGRVLDFIKDDRGTVDIQKTGRILLSQLENSRPIQGYIAVTVPEAVLQKGRLPCLPCPM